MAGLLLVIPDLVALDLPALAEQAGYPGTRVIPAASWLLSLLALKLTATRRVSHVDDLLPVDPAAAMLAGLATLPKKSALTSYSYRASHNHQRAFLAALDQKMIAAGLASGEQAIFDLDFHAVMHWGEDPALEKHYVPTRSQRARSVLTFFAQDSGTHNLVYANADLSKATQAREAMAFCDHWKSVSGADPRMLVMDQKVTTHAVLGELDRRGVRFLTLRMRSKALMKQINALAPADYKTITLDRGARPYPPASRRGPKRGGPSRATAGRPQRPARPPARLRPPSLPARCRTPAKPSRPRTHPPLCGGVLDRQPHNAKHLPGRGSAQVRRKATPLAALSRVVAAAPQPA